MALDPVQRSQKVLGEVPRLYIMLGTFDLKLEGRNYGKNLLILATVSIFHLIEFFFDIFNMFNRSVRLKYPYLDTS